MSDHLFLMSTKPKVVNWCFHNYDDVIFNSVYVVTIIIFILVLAIPIIVGYITVDCKWNKSSSSLQHYGILNLYSS